VVSRRKLGGRKRFFTALVAAGAGLLFALSATAPSVAAGKVVAFKSNVARGTIVVRTNERRLYLVTRRGRAISYPVGVGRAGRQWAGTSVIKAKHVSPNWAPPPAIRRDRPDLPAVIPGGAPNNPMGVAALTLSGGDYAIHGTNAPKSIGRFVSYGCIRMLNEDITDLFKRVRVGTRVVVMR
jgi:lipoprotein-anchoring transpeptidase ErfK/SrfK